MPEQLPAQSSKGTASRRSHRKSRLGCQNCKRRRIKCDEKRPECTNCLRHAIHCDFAPAAAASSRSAASSPANHLSPHDALLASATTPSGPGGVPSPFMNAITPVLSVSAASNVSDLELLHNWSTATAHTVSSIPDFQAFYRINVPQIGFSYPFVLHAIMAISARHLAQFRASSRPSYTAKADHHWAIALRTATALIPAVDDDNAPALYIFAVLSCFYTFAKGPKPRDFLVFSDHGPAEWLPLFRGVRTIMETTRDAIRHGPLSTLFTSAVSLVQAFYDHDTSNEHPRVAELRQLALDIATDSPNLPTYIAAIDDVSRSFACTYHLDDTAVSGHSQTIFVWLYRVSDDFVLCLQQKQPMALAIFAYFIVLVNEIGNVWWIKDWVYHLISGIYDSMDEGSRPWIRWPIEKLGWIPDY
ncbi:C6 zinc finger protein [Macrophomina phaseolina]|uniref:C6 zinc finger protein n=1 Tax=Macrophomina phaseolina TaxID=35725 RepID=A0ABQ8FS53_9PEZI|nr:C6 zinc finger protein [Macrophomina phaseolina]